MLWFLIVPALWTWLFHSAWIETDRYALITWPSGLVGWAGMLFGMFVIALIGGMIAGGIASGIGAILNDAEIWILVDRSTEKLVAVRDKDGIDGKIAGSLFMVAGYLESRPYYFYYTEDKDGAIRPEKIKASRNVYIHEIESSEQPKFVERQWDNSRPWLDLFAFTSGGWQNHFYVPKGTVRRDFTM